MASPGGPPSWPCSGRVLVGIAAGERPRAAQGPCACRVGALGLGLLLPLEHWAPPRPAAAVPTGGSVPAVYAWLAGESREPVADLPLYPDRAKKLWAAYLHLSTAHWRPIPIGRTSFYPPAHDFLLVPRGFPDDISLPSWSAWVSGPSSCPGLVPAGADGRLAATEIIPAAAGARFRPSSARYARFGLGAARLPALAAPPVGPVPTRGESPGGLGPASTRVNKEIGSGTGSRTTWMWAAREAGNHLEVTLAGPRRWPPRPDSATFDEFPRPGAGRRAGGDGGWRRIAFADGPAA
jgi:hypothetical protein